MHLHLGQKRSDRAACCPGSVTSAWPALPVSYLDTSETVAFPPRFVLVQTYSVDKKNDDDTVDAIPILDNNYITSFRDKILPSVL